MSCDRTSRSLLRSLLSSLEGRPIEDLEAEHASVLAWIDEHADRQRRLEQRTAILEARVQEAEEKARELAAGIAGLDANWQAWILDTTE